MEILSESASNSTMIDAGVKLLHRRDLSCFIVENQAELIAEELRDARKSEANDFRWRYSYGSGLEHKTFVWPSGVRWWSDKSSGTIWVGMQGMDSICVVTRTADLDLARVHRDYKYLTTEAVLRGFRKTVISEIEDLASQSSKLHKIFGPRIPKPFSVVSVVPCTGNDHKESGHEASSDENEEDEEDKEEESRQVSNGGCESNKNKLSCLLKALRKSDKKKRREASQSGAPKIAGYDETKTIKYLREQMRKDAPLLKCNQVSSTKYYEGDAINFLLEKMKTMTVEDFSVDETIKASISAFQHLFRKEFKANEIEVTVMDPKYFVSSAEEAKYKGVYVKELELSEIKYYLDAINETSSAWCCKDGGFLKRRLLEKKPEHDIWKGITEEEQQLG